MSKQLPYFKFYIGEWLGGDIQLCKAATKGIFIDIVALAWKNDGIYELNRTNLERRLRVGSTDLQQALDELIELEIIYIDGDDDITIDFITEQLEERMDFLEKCRLAGVKSGKVRSTNPQPTPNQPSTLLNQPSTLLNQPPTNKKRREKSTKEKKKRKEEETKPVRSTNLAKFLNEYPVIHESVLGYPYPHKSPALTKYGLIDSEINRIGLDELLNRYKKFCETDNDFAAKCAWSVEGFMGSHGNFASDVKNRKQQAAAKAKQAERKRIYGDDA